MSADWPGIAIGKFHTKFDMDRSLPVRRLDWLALGDNIFSLPRELIVIAGALVNAGRDNAGQSNALHTYLYPQVRSGTCLYLVLILRSRLNSATISTLE